MTSDVMAPCRPVEEEIDRLAHEHLDRGARRRLSSALLRAVEVLEPAERPVLLSDATLHHPGLFVLTDSRLLFIREHDLELTWAIRRRSVTAEALGGNRHNDVLVHEPDGTVVLADVGLGEWAVELAEAIGPAPGPRGRACPSCGSWIEPPLWQVDRCLECGMTSAAPPEHRLFDDTLRIWLPDRPRRLRGAVERLRSLLAPAEHATALFAADLDGPGLLAVTDRRVVFVDAVTEHETLGVPLAAIADVEADVEDDRTTLRFAAAGRPIALDVRTDPVSAADLVEALQNEPRTDSS